MSLKSTLLITSIVFGGFFATGCVENTKRGIEVDPKKAPDSLTDGGLGGLGELPGDTPPFDSGNGNTDPLPGSDPGNGGNGSTPPAGNGDTTPPAGNGSTTPPSGGGTNTDPSNVTPPGGSGNTNVGVKPELPAGGSNSSGNNSTPPVGGDSTPKADPEPVVQNIVLTITPILPAVGQQQIKAANNGNAQNNAGGSGTPANTGSGNIKDPAGENPSKIDPYTFEEFCTTYPDVCSDGGVWVL